MLRAAIPADLPRIGVIRQAVKENVLRDPSKVSDEEVAWYMEQAIFLVSEEGGEVVGFTCANHQTALIWALFIAPDHEGHGHGRALLDAALERLAEKGHRQAYLTTGATTRAARFYRQHGWRDMGLALDGQAVFVKPLGPVSGANVVASAL